MGYLLNEKATISCPHQGQASPTVTDQRVKVGGQKIVTQLAPYTLSGCSLPTQSGGPCATATYTSAATRVKASGQPVLLSDSQATCAPTGASLNIMMTQMRVKGK